MGTIIMLRRSHGGGLAMLSERKMDPSTRQTALHWETEDRRIHGIVQMSIRRKARTTIPGLVVGAADGNFTEIITASTITVIIYMTILSVYTITNTLGAREFFFRLDLRRQCDILFVS